MNRIIVIHKRICIVMYFNVPIYRNIFSEIYIHIKVYYICQKLFIQSEKRKFNLLYIFNNLYFAPNTITAKFDSCHDDVYLYLRCLWIYVCMILIKYVEIRVVYIYIFRFYWPYQKKIILVANRDMEE